MNFGSIFREFCSYFNKMFIMFWEWLQHLFFRACLVFCFCSNLTWSETTCNIFLVLAMQYVALQWQEKNASSPTCFQKDFYNLQHQKKFYRNAVKLKRLFFLQCYDNKKVRTYFKKFVTFWKFIIITIENIDDVIKLIKVL